MNERFTVERGSTLLFLFFSSFTCSTAVARSSLLRYKYEKDRTVDLSVKISPNIVHIDLSKSLVYVSIHA